MRPGLPGLPGAASPAVSVRVQSFRSATRSAAAGAATGDPDGRYGDGETTFASRREAARTLTASSAFSGAGISTGTSR